ncbi:MAG: hypothetical protein J1D87_08370, partial [Lachnospiraceae bacterium]|nr:hypothetical protein [Lachnospiraceae bacterium]
CFEDVDIPAERKRAREEGLKEGREEGLKEGREEGIKKGEQRLLELINLLKDSGRDKDLSHALSDQVYREQLYQQYNL